MARIVKPGPSEPHVAFKMLSDHSPAWELNLVKGGKLAYIWTPAGTYSGTETLRKLAKAILKEISRRAKVT